MTSFARRRIPLLLVGVLAGGACSSVLGSGDLHLEVTAGDAVVSPSGPAVIQVKATNVGAARVTWGPGSSTCQFRLFVRVNGVDLLASAFNGPICTADSRRLRLNPGESRTETLEWTGLVQNRSALVPLQPGVYELRAAAAGAEMRSDPVTIEVRDEIESF